MSVESNYAIVIATHGDWLINLALVFNQLEVKTKAIASCTREFSRA